MVFVALGLAFESWGLHVFSSLFNLIDLTEYSFAKSAIWVKDGVPSQARGYTGGTARPSPRVNA
jgi:hypothetical protein